MTSPRGSGVRGIVKPNHYPHGMSDTPAPSEFMIHNDEPPRRPPTWVRVVAAVLVIGLLGLYVLRPSSKSGGKAIGDFTLVPLTGSGQTIHSEDLRGKPVVINFWASWCTPCRREMPHLQRVWEKYRDEGVLFIGVDVKDAPDSATAFLEKVRVTYPVVVDEDEALLQALGITTGLPQTFFLRPSEDAIDDLLEGRWRDAGNLVLGEMNEEEIEAQIEALIGASTT